VSHHRPAGTLGTTRFIGCILYIDCIPKGFRMDLSGRSSTPATVQNVRIDHPELGILGQISAIGRIIYSIFQWYMTQKGSHCYCPSYTQLLARLSHSKSSQDEPRRPQW
jgi:hypothetical protein